MEPRQVFRSYDPASAPAVVDLHCARCGNVLAPPADGNGRRCTGCGQVSYRNATPAVSVLVVEGDRIVLGRRAPSAFRGGQWCLPCGFVDWDEDFLAAGRREVLEESGLAVSINSIVSVVSN